MKQKTSKYRGVSFQKSTDLWVASVGVGKRRFAKYAGSEEGAAKLYDQMAIQWLRGAAKTNFPLSDYPMPELPPVIGADGLLTSEHVRDACHKYILVQGLLNKSRMSNWAVVDNLFFPEGKKMSMEWMFEFCWKLGIDPMGEDL